MLTDSERKSLDGLLDQIIPPNADNSIPGAGQLGTADFVIDKTAKDPEFAAALRKGLRLAGDDAGKFEAALPEIFAALQRYTYMGYYSRSDTRPLFGVSARPIHPSGYDVAAEPEDLMKKLTAPVVARGRCYRET